MNLKTLFLSVAALAIGTAGSAQDRIYKKNGDVIEGKVKTVDTRSVTYKRADNAKGPDYTVNKNELERVEYENGTEDVFSDRKKGRDDDEDMDGREVRPRSHREDNGRKAHKKKIDYGANILAFAPAQATENGFGIGLSYEHNFGKKGIVSLYIPFMLSFGNVEDNFANSNGTINGDWNSYTNLAVMIGPKIYPGGSKGKVKYAIAPMLSIVSGQRPVNYYVYDQNLGYITNVNGNKENFQFGGLIVNSLNMSPSKHLYIGMELGWGFTFVDQENGITRDSRPMVEFAFKLGYRF